jgi:hypothetical protein
MFVQVLDASHGIPKRNYYERSASSQARRKKSVGKLLKDG